MSEREITYGIAGAQAPELGKDIEWIDEKGKGERHEAHSVE